MNIVIVVIGSNEPVEISQLPTSGIHTIKKISPNSFLLLGVALAPFDYVEKLKKSIPKSPVYVFGLDYSSKAMRPADDDVRHLIEEHVGKAPTIPES